MKKIISLILCVLMLVPCFAFLVSAEGTPAVAEEQEEERINFAPNGGAYASSKWNNDSDPKYINNGALTDSYRFWRPDGVGRNPYLDSTMQYCGIKFSDNYYEVQEVVIYNMKYAVEEKNNIRYVVKALVLGEWVTIGEAYNDDPNNIEHVEDSNILTIDVTDVVTKHIRIECSEYGEHAEDKNWHNWWKIPIIHEVQTWGHVAEPPAWDVPDGAVLSTNACLSGFAHATSANAMLNIYPALVNDDLKLPTLNTTRPYWQANNRGGGESIWCNFDTAYDIVDVTLNFGGSTDNISMKYDVDIQLSDGTWINIAKDQEVTSTAAAQDDIVYKLDKVYNAVAVKVVFTEAKSGARPGAALLTEMGATISPNNIGANGQIMDKCVFLKDYVTTYKKQSAASGNLAGFGTAYASSTFTYANMSAVEYINDGGIRKVEDYSWFSQTFEKGTYCGVVLKEKFNVNKVVLYFNDPTTGSVSGDCVMRFDIQVKDANGNFVTVAKDVTSYDEKNKEYIVSIEFETVETDDVRLVFTSNGLVFPYIKELEVYSSEQKYDSFVGHPMASRVNGGKVANTFDDLAKRTVVPRSRYLDMISPIQYFDIVTNFNIDVASWS